MRQPIPGFASARLKTQEFMTMELCNLMAEMDRGVVIFSVDLELARGFNYEILKRSKLASQYLPIIRIKSALKLCYNSVQGKDQE